MDDFDFSKSKLVKRLKKNAKLFASFSDIINELHNRSEFNEFRHRFPQSKSKN